MRKPLKALDFAPANITHAITPVSSPAQRILDEYRRQDRVHAGSLIISVLGDAVVPRGGRVWLGSLIRLLEPLGLNERLVRTAVFRLVRDEWLTSARSGRRTDYLLTPSGEQRIDEASRLIYAAAMPQWDRRWRLIVTVGELSARDRERLRKALAWHGFGALNSDCFVHPGVDLIAVFDALVAEGLGELVDRLKPLIAADAALRTAEARIGSLESQVDSATAALDGVRQEALVGARTVLDVLDAEQELFAAEVELTRARREAVMAGYRMLAARGELSVAGLGLEVEPYDPEGHYREVRDKWYGLGEDRSE